MAIIGKYVFGKDFFSVSFPGSRKSAIKEIRSLRSKNSQYKYKMYKSGDGYTIFANRRKK